MTEKTMQTLRSEAKARGITLPRGTTREEAKALLSDQEATPAGAASIRETGGQVRIVRSDDLSWWCPVCGTSNVNGNVTCGGCAARRDSGSVTAA